MKQSRTNKKNVTIPNWTHFGVGHTIIELVEHVNPDNHDDVIYNGFVTFFLLDGEELEKGSEKVISLNTRIFDEDPYDAALMCAELALELFGRVSRMVYIFNDEGEMIDELEIAEHDIIDSENDEDKESDSDDKDTEQLTTDDLPMGMKIPKKRVLH